MIARAVSWLLVLAAAIAPADAQVRDAVRPAGGAGVIAGTVVADGEPAVPVRRAIVTLNSGEPSVGRTAITDDRGRFVFTNLPPARYSIGASKRGWVPAPYGAKAIGRPGHPLRLEAGEQATAVIRMARGAVISGTLLDQFGQPLSGVALRVMKYGYSFNSSERQLLPVSSQTSGPDERGAYRIYGLAPGEYYVVATNASALSSAGRDLHLTSDVDVQEALRSTRAGTGLPIPDVPQPNVGYSRIFYPGALSVAQATPITLRAGEERPGIDFAIQYAPVARVEGTILSPSGTPVSAHVRLVANDPGGGPVGFESIRRTNTGSDGRFVFAEIAPGPYVLSADHMKFGAMGEQPQTLSASTDLDVQSELVSGISMTVQEGLTVSGTIRYDGTAAAPDLTTLHVVLTDAQPSAGGAFSAGSVTAGADGRFTMRGISPGRYRLRVESPSPQVTWALRSAALLGQDAVDFPVDVRQPVTDATITLTDRISELSGRVETSSGGSADGTLILFSTDRAHWGPQSRRVMIARPASDAFFRFPSVRPGEYYLLLVDDAEPGEWLDPAFLQRIAPTAQRVTIAEGEKKVQNVRGGGG